MLNYWQVFLVCDQYVLSKKKVNICDLTAKYGARWVLFGQTLICDVRNKQIIVPGELSMRGWGLCQDFYSWLMCIWKVVALVTSYWHWVEESYHFSLWRISFPLWRSSLALNLRTAFYNSLVEECLHKNLLGLIFVPVRKRKKWCCSETKFWQLPVSV